MKPINTWKCSCTSNGITSDYVVHGYINQRAYDKALIDMSWKKLSKFATVLCPVCEAEIDDCAVTLDPENDNDQLLSSDVELVPVFIPWDAFALKITMPRPPKALTKYLHERNLAIVHSRCWEKIMDGSSIKPKYRKACARQILELEGLPAVQRYLKNLIRGCVPDEFVDEGLQLAESTIYEQQVFTTPSKREAWDKE